jgi:hypothetical protein
MACAQNALYRDDFSRECFHRGLYSFAIEDFGINARPVFPTAQVNRKWRRWPLLATRDGADAKLLYSEANSTLCQNPL